MHYTLRKGDKGQEVRRLQRMVGVSPDGDFGPKTDIAVKDYQHIKGFVVDGIAGPVTLGALGIEVLPGVDLSSHNGKIDFASMARSGVKYAWVKLTEGTTHVNPGFEDKIRGCRDHGILVGAYHFGRPDTYVNDPCDARKEADNFLNALNKVGGLKCGDLLPVLDLEAGVKVDDQYNIEWALHWLEAVGCSKGIRPIVYTARWYYHAYMKRANKLSLDKLADYPLWWACYNDGAEPEKDIDPWTHWDVWQWTGSGAVPGVRGRCDQNWLAGGRLNKLTIP